MGLNVRGNCSSCAVMQIKSAGVHLPWWGIAQTDYPNGTPYWCGLGLFKDVYDPTQHSGYPNPIATVVDDMTGKVSSPDPAYDGTYLDWWNAAHPGEYRSGVIQASDVLARCQDALNAYDLDTIDWGKHVRLTYNIVGGENASGGVPIYKGPRTAVPVETWINAPSYPGDIQVFYGTQQGFGATASLGGTFGLSKIQIKATGFTKACIQHGHASDCRIADTWEKTVPCSALNKNGDIELTQIISLESGFPNTIATGAWLQPCAQCTKSLPPPCYD